MGVVLIATLAFGLITPPYGLVLLMASKFVGVSFGKALRAALPIYVVFLVTICFTIYFPKVVLWLPKQVIPESVGCFKSPAGTGYICPNYPEAVMVRTSSCAKDGIQYSGAVSDLLPSLKARRGSRFRG